MAQKGRYTKYSNKIGLYSTSKGSYINNDTDVVLNFPFKDTVLEAGMSKEDVGREEATEQHDLRGEEQPDADLGIPKAGVRPGCDCVWDFHQRLWWVLAKGSCGTCESVHVGELVLDLGTSRQPLR